MLTKITDVPDYVAAFRASGEVDKNDYKNVLMPEIERVDKAHGHIHCLYVLETPVKNFSVGAWIEDAWTGIKHYRGWKKVALVTDDHTLESMADKISFIIPGKVKGFKLSELDAAKEWVASEN